MKVYISDTILGIFLLDEKEQVYHFERYKDVEVALENISQINIGSTPAILEKILPKLRGYEVTVTDNPRIANILRGEDINIEYVTPCKLLIKFRDSLPSYAVSQGLVGSREEFNEFERSLLYGIAKIKVKAISERRDIYAAQMVRALDDIDKSLNLFSGRIREWFGLHFPELDKITESHETYLKLVEQVGMRDKWTVKALKKTGIKDEKIEQLSDAAENSIGAEISNEDLGKLQSFCKECLTLFKLREEISLYVDRVMEEFAPNLLSIMGSLIAARLVSLAGGIQNLAKMPASTIQVLGAEKALFRHLKTGTRPPKHGIIFQHAAIHQSPKWQRGKIARAMAAKIAIAARLDAYGGGFQGDQLKADLEKRIEEIRRRFQTPPKKVKGHGKRRKGKRA